MRREGILSILSVALAVCIVCSVLVSGAAVLLRERQEANRSLFRQEAILRAARLYDPARPVSEQFSVVTPRIIDLKIGRLVPKGAAVSPRETEPIPPDKDLAGLRSRSRYREVYLVAPGGKLEQIVLPVEGKGLWSTMSGFIALGRDCSTITGFGFYQHGETPGLGGEVDNPRWLARWPGKKAFEGETYRLEVVKGAVDPASAEARYQVDGLSGATLTTRGVDNLLRYWLGSEGYGPFLARLRATGGVVDEK